GGSIEVLRGEMMAETIFYFIRHGVTYWNLEGRMQGHAQNSLSEAGEEQAAKVARRLKEESANGDAFYCSDLKRAMQTAAAISEALELPVAAYDERLRERGLGQLENTIEQERIERWGENWHELDLGRESDASMQARGLEFVNDMAARHPGG